MASIAGASAGSSGERHVGVAEDRHEEVVEIVGDAAREDAQAFELLGAEQRFFRLLALRYVAHDREMHAMDDVRDRLVLGQRQRAIAREDDALPALGAVVHERGPASAGSNVAVLAVSLCTEWVSSSSRE